MISCESYATLVSKCSKEKSPATSSKV
jgi:hypothetical protein